jgi:hypothetical protein
VKKRPEGEESVESVEGNYVDVSKYSPPDISQYTSHEVEELLLSKVRRDYSVPVPLLNPQETAISSRKQNSI